MFGGGVSASKVDKLSQTFHKFRVAWQNTKLEKSYKVVFADVIFVKVRRGDSYSKEGVYVAYGVREDTKRELLILDTNPTESSTIWGEFFQDLKEKRGVENIDLVVADGIQSNSIENVNRAIRKATKNKLSFESPDKMMDYIFMVVKEFEEKNFMRYPVSNYKYFGKV